MSARILLVEDDPVSQDLLRRILQARGHQVDNSGGVQYKPGLWKFFSALGSR